MKKNDRNYWLNAWFYALVALGLAWVFDQWIFTILTIPLDGVESHWLLKLSLVGTVIVFGYRLKYSLIFIGVVAVLLAFTALVLPTTFGQWWQWLELLIQNYRISLYWIFYETGVLSLIPELTPLLIQCTTLLLGILLTFVLSNGWLTLVLIGIPMFYFPIILMHPYWLVVVLIGLSLALTLLFKPRIGRLHQQPINLITMVSISLVLALLTYHVSNWLGPEPFYNSWLNQWLTQDSRFDLVDQLDDPFSLFHAGYYGSDRRIGGPVSVNHEVALTVLAEYSLPSIYLRGPVYTEFSDNRWRYSLRNVLNTFQDIDEIESFGPDYFEDHQASVFGYGERDFNRTFTRLIVLPNFDRLQMVFHGGQPIQLAHLDDETDHQFHYTSFGEIYATPALNRSGYLTIGTFYESFNRDHVALDGKIAAAGYPQQERYKALLDQYDPVLSELVYAQAPPDLSRVLAIVDHFNQNYRYTLEVSPIPFGQAFVETFLRDKEGYCVYYGSLLTLLLQDMGFNARYVEGYVVPEGSGMSTSFTSARVVTNSSAHAWTELYIEDIGWYPLDATPSSHLSYLSTYQRPDLPGPQPQTPTETDPIDETSPETPIPAETETNDIETGPESGPNEPITHGIWQPFLISLFLVGLIAVGFERVQSYRHRLDLTYLRSYQKKSRHDLVRWIWKDILTIAGYDLDLSEKSLTMSQIFGLITDKYYLHDRYLLEPAQRVLLEIHFSNHRIDETDFERFIEFYRSVQRRHQRLSHSLLYFIRRLFGGPHL